jgi:predicted house-cleaning noncanonical NTP pyrophosphatase (MazG superfamily)
MAEKLVRDAIPEIILANDDIPTYRYANPEEVEGFFLRKLEEEVAELRAAPHGERFIEELADVTEVLAEILRWRAISRDQIERVRDLKRREKGGFLCRIILSEPYTGRPREA